MKNLVKGSRVKERLKFAEENAFFGILWIMSELMVRIIVWGILFVAGAIIMGVGAGFSFFIGSGLVILWEWIWY